MVLITSYWIIFVVDQEVLEIPINFGFDYPFQNVAWTILANFKLPEISGQNATVDLKLNMAFAGEDGTFVR